MATVAPSTPAAPEGTIVLADVSWETYCQLRDAEANDAVRMTYLDGTLTLTSPEIKHDRPIELLASIVRGTTVALGLPILSIRTTTLRKMGPGVGKEADAAYYIGPDEALMRGCEDLDLATYPPPNLAIEVDNSRNSAAAMTIYARLGVQEVWRHSTRKHSLQIYQLGQGEYREAGRSIILPPLTPAAIIAALDRYGVRDLDENAWFEWIKAWARTLPGPDAAT